MIWDDTLGIASEVGIEVGDILVLPDNVVLKWPDVINEALSASEKMDSKISEIDLDNEQLSLAASALFDNTSPLAQRQYMCCKLCTESPHSKDDS